MGANADHYVDSTEIVEKLDDTGIRLTRGIGPITAFSLEHTWIPCGDHTHYFTEMNVGARGRAKHASLITIGPHFIPELIKMANDV